MSVNVFLNNRRYNLGLRVESVTGSVSILLPNSEEELLRAGYELPIGLWVITLLGGHGVGLRNSSADLTATILGLDDPGTGVLFSGPKNIVIPHCGLVWTNVKIARYTPR